MRENRTYGLMREGWREPVLYSTLKIEGLEAEVLANGARYLQGRTALVESGWRWLM